MVSGCRKGEPNCRMPGPTADEAQVRSAPLVMLQGATLNRAKTANFGCPDGWGGDVQKLKFSANRMQDLPLRSVTEKTGLAPSGDIHDYLSSSRYFWPDPSKPDGLPWKRQDGRINPVVLSDRYDKAASDAMFSTVITLAAAYFFVGDEAYAGRAAEQVRVWFLDPATKMNPHLSFAEGVPGGASGRAQGLIEFSKLVDIFDAVALLAASPAWTVDDAAQFRQWMESYDAWLSTHKFAVKEDAAKNNHGTYFDAQRAALAVHLGKTDAARALIERAKSKRIAAQILADGTQPEELARANSWFYSAFNLIALMDLASIGEHVGVDLWRYTSDDGRSIRAALDFLLPFAFEGKAWPYTGTVEAGLLYESLLRAAVGFDEPRYAELARSIAGKTAEDEEKARGMARLFWGHGEARSGI